MAPKLYGCGIHGGVLLVSVSEGRVLLFLLYEGVPVLRPKKHIPVRTILHINQVRKGYVFVEVKRNFFQVIPDISDVLLRYVPVLL